jgi:hypothetical protein
MKIRRGNKYWFRRQKPYNYDKIRQFLRDIDPNELFDHYAIELYTDDFKLLKRGIKMPAYTLRIKFY